MTNFWCVQTKRYEIILENLREGIILNLACVGSGKENLHSFLVENTNQKVIGVDKIEHRDVNIKADLNKRFPFEDNFAENIVAGAIIEHMFNPFFFLQECYRVLKSGGRLILTTDNAIGLLYLTKGDWPDHKCTFTVKMMVRIMESVNFKIKKAFFFNADFNRNLLIRTIGFLIPKLKSGIFIVAEK